MKLRWKETLHEQNQTSFNGYVGSHHCFTVYARLQREGFVFSCHLPGVSDILVLEDIESCREKAREILRNWVDGFKEG
jgi:hypothetical protein